VEAEVARAEESMKYGSRSREKPAGWNENGDGMLEEGIQVEAKGTSREKRRMKNDLSYPIILQWPIHKIPESIRRVPPPSTFNRFSLLTLNVPRERESY
jgi:hypothetical protein